MIVVLALSALSSCATPAGGSLVGTRDELANGVPITIRTTGPHFDLNYKLGEQRIARVGQPMVRTSEFYRRWQLHAHPSNDFTFRNGMFDETHRFCVDNEYPVSAMRSVEGVEYRAVDCGLFDLLIHADGKSLKIKSSFVGVPIRDQTVTPETTTFSFEERESTYPGSQNFELDYLGIDAGTIKLQYREYTRDDLARPAFFQELSYDKSQSTIVFRSIKLRVDEITPDGIAYTVLEDGLPASAGAAGQ